jgi:hypothetical protein
MQFRKFRTMNKVNKSSDSECYTSSSESFGFYNFYFENIITGRKSAMTVMRCNFFYRNFFFSSFYEKYMTRLEGFTAQS